MSACPSLRLGGEVEIANSRNSLCEIPSPFSVDRTLPEKRAAKRLSNAMRSCAYFLRSNSYYRYRSFWASDETRDTRNVGKFTYRFEEVRFCPTSEDLR